MAIIPNGPTFEMNTTSAKRGYASFVVSFAGIFVLTFIALSVTGLVPEGIKELNGATLGFITGKSTVLSADSSKETDSPPVDKTLRSETEELPKAIMIPSIALSAPIQAPESTDTLVLDDALRFGPVHYPGSANLGELGNMFIFGHSSELKVVNNQAFKVFNRINQLKIGSEIIVRSDTHEHVYTVSRVSLVDQSKELVELGGNAKKLTLSTCNSFGAKTERYVVEADFVRSYPIAR